MAFILARSVHHLNKNIHHPDTITDRASTTEQYPEKAEIVGKLASDPIEVQKVFALIDRILPFEACLYHEVLPLSLDGRSLHLGMVNLTDVFALDYARKILSFLNYTLIPQVIPIEMQHRVLSQYLQFKGQAVTIQEDPTVFFEAEEIEQVRTTLQSVATPTPASVPLRHSHPPLPVAILRPQIDRETLIVESPEELDDWVSPQNTSDSAVGSLAIASPVNPAAPATPATNLQSMLQSVNDETVIQNFDDRSPAQQPPESHQKLPSTNLLDQTLPTPGDALPTLAIRSTYATSSPDVLKALDSTELLENLLGEVLAGGIGRLYFELQQDSGRVLSSNSGVLQSMIESLPIDRFESLIWALKNLMKVHPEPVTEPLQVEIERWHEKNRLLLRLRLMPKWADDELVGEEATLQILRGAALRFYQQHQSTQLRRDTLLVAQNLQLKVEALQQRSIEKSHPEMDQRATDVANLGTQ